MTVVTEAFCIFAAKMVAWTRLDTWTGWGWTLNRDDLADYPAMSFIFVR